MGNSSSSPSQIISLPKGGGAQHGLGEKFSPDLHTGTGNFTVPIALPPGRNGFQPQLSLVYSTGNGNGLFGLGWGLSIPGVTRKTAKGIPRYQDYHNELKERDTFILSGAEDLVPIKDVDPIAKTATQYRPRTEGLFAKIIHHHDTVAKKNFWEVRSKDGLISYYGTNPDDKAAYPVGFVTDNDPATLTKPDDWSRAFAWKLTLTKDPFDNRIEYVYDERDESPSGGKDGHLWNQPLLKHIQYVDYKNETATKFLVTVTFEYEDGRADPFSDYRAGFEIRTTKRCKSILIETHADQDYKVRCYEFTYRNDALNKISLLQAIGVVGFDDAGVESRELPPLEFSYSDFNPKDQKRRDFYPVQGPDLPATSLANSSMELVDLFGNGLPDVLEMNGTVRYWRNRGNGQFDLSRRMTAAPAGVTLADPGVQIIDANGDGRADLLVTQGVLSGYYPLQFGGLWDRRSFQKYQSPPSFDLKDPEVRLLDLTGDGVTDVLRSSTRLECYYNDPHEGWQAGNSRWVERQALEVFPNVNFSDPRVKFAEMTGDGMQDIVLVYDGNIEYWPNLGYGNWDKRLHMKNSPRFPFGYDPKRVLLGDVDGDGLADLIYVDDRKVTLWINQNGNGWSDAIEIPGTPPVSDMDATRLVDLLGSGISGVLWTRDATSARQDHYFFLDLTGGTKPYVLHEMNNNMGAVTKVGYAPSTHFYLQDEKKKDSRWKTPLPFPVQVVARVEVIDELSQGKLTTEYKYHHGYWDGGEREFRGFGMVEQFDTETFVHYHQAGLRGDPNGFKGVAETHFSPPTRTKTWFHQGPVGEEFGEWDELEFSQDYWNGDPQLLNYTEAIRTYLKNLGSTYSTLTTRQQRKIKRDALRTLRGSILRTELYALDGSPLQERPYTVTEHAYSLKEVEPPPNGDRDRLHIFFPHSIAQRTTQWERGDDPMTQFSFTDDYDDFGQPWSQTTVACPRGWRNRGSQSNAYLATRVRTLYAKPQAGAEEYLHDRVIKTTSFEITNKTDWSNVTNDASRTIFQMRDLIDSDRALKVIGQTLNFYDFDTNQAENGVFNGLRFGQIGMYGALVKTETLVLTRDILHESYKSKEAVLANPEEPSYLDATGSVTWSAEYPQGFRDKLPALAGYTYHIGGPGSEYAAGYFAASERREYDFHINADGHGKGLQHVTRDPLGNDTSIEYDRYSLLPIKVTDAATLKTTAEYNYRVLQPKHVTDPNGNKTEFVYNSIGLLNEIWIKGKDDAGNLEGDRQRPSTRFEYDFLATLKRKEPISVRTIRQVHHDTETDVPSGMDVGHRDQTIEMREYSDGFGRLLQTRAQGEDAIFGDRNFGAGTLPVDQNDEAGTQVAVFGTQNNDTNAPNVVVSGWQVHDNKGRVVEKYEPFFHKGWNYVSPNAGQLGVKAVMFYDPRGQVIRTVNPDGSEQLVIYGVPPDLDHPDGYTPTPWEAYTYDANDNSGRTHVAESAGYRHHRNTPSSVLIDAMGRPTTATGRNRAAPVSATAPLANVEELVTRTHYDIRGNVLIITDPLGRDGFRYTYDLANRPWRIDSIDAGLRRIVLNAAGDEIERRDKKEALVLRSYDKLNRPTHVWARDGRKEKESLTLRERIIYGDAVDSGLTATQVSKGNFLAKLFQHYDEAGRVQIDRYDFKGNILEKNRRVIQDAQLRSIYTGSPFVAYRVDWTLAVLESAAKRDERADALLEAFSFETSVTFDALNRIKAMTYPRDVGGNRKELRPHYNRAGALEAVHLDTDVYVERIAYNAKGQRTFIAYGNQVMTRYSYDSETFRLRRMRTERFRHPNHKPLTYEPDLSSTPEDRLLQDFAYDYDLIGNILKIHDQTPKSGTPADPEKLDRVFSYDPLYRLRSATGRECDAATQTPPWDDTVRCTDPNSTRPYTQTYTYDKAGTMTLLGHQTLTRPAASFSRAFTVVPENNRLETMTVTVGATPKTHYVYTYDPNGNMMTETESRKFEWDHADRLKAFESTDGVSNTSVHAQYLYDAAGQRVKKFVRNQQRQVEVTVYIDGIFEYYQWEQGVQTKSNNRVHIINNQSRIALFRIGDMDDQKPDVQYQLGDHLGSSNLVVGGSSAKINAFINREEFFPYGETSFGSFGRKRYRYTSKERDEESGLSHHGARLYCAWLARWISCDPAILVLDRRTPVYDFASTTYSYSKLNPLLFVDIDGKAGKVFYVTVDNPRNNDDPAMMHAKKYGDLQEKNEKGIHLRVKSLEDLVEQLDANLGRDDTIKQIFIETHGNPQGGVLIPSIETEGKRGYQYPETLEKAADRMDKLGRIQQKSPNAKVTLHACNVAQSESAMKKWARFFGGKNVTVEATTEFILWRSKGDNVVIYLDKDMLFENGVLGPLGSKAAEKYMKRITVNEGPLGSDVKKGQTKSPKPEAPQVPTAPMSKPREYHFEGEPASMEEVFHPRSDAGRR